MNKKQFQTLIERLDKIIALLAEEEGTEADGDGDCDPEMFIEALEALEGHPIPLLGEPDDEEEPEKLFVV